MAAETGAVRTLARRAKTAALNKAVEILEHPEKHPVPLYEQTYLTVLKNAVPRTQEITGEDGGPVEVKLTPAERNKLLGLLEPEVDDDEESPPQSNNGEAE